MVPDTERFLLKQTSPRADYYIHILTKSRILLRQASHYNNNNTTTGLPACHNNTQQEATYHEATETVLLQIKGNTIPQGNGDEIKPGPASRALSTYTYIAGACSSLLQKQ